MIVVFSTTKNLGRVESFQCLDLRKFGAWNQVPKEYSNKWW